MKRIISAVLVALMIAALLVGCGSNPAGHYVVKSIDGKSVDEALQSSADAAGMSKEDYLKQLGVPSAEEIIVMDLKSDNTAVMEIKMFSTTKEGTWKQDGDKVTITIDNDGADFTFKGNELTSQTGDQQYVFVKK